VPFTLAFAAAWAENPPVFFWEKQKMKNPLDTLWGTVISGLVLTVILYYVVKFALGA
jgi:predicted PurR-regulated permease PerM